MNRGIVNVSKALCGLAAAVALTAALTACGSSGSSRSVSLADLAGVPAPVTVSPAPDNAVPTPTVPARTTAPAITVTTNPATGGQVAASFPTSASAQAPSRTEPPTASSSPVRLSGPVTFSSASFPRPYDCAETGTTYYTPPNVAIALDVTLLVNSSTLAHDLTIDPPNPAPRGLSNASEFVSATSEGNGVWRATYRTYVSLYEPHYAPVTVSSLAASAAGSSYTITFSSPVSVTIGNCRS